MKWNALVLHINTRRQKMSLRAWTFSLSIFLVQLGHERNKKPQKLTTLLRSTQKTKAYFLVFFGRSPVSLDASKPNNCIHSQRMRESFVLSIFSLQIRLWMWDNVSFHAPRKCHRDVAGWHTTVHLEATTQQAHVFFVHSTLNQNWDDIYSNRFFLVESIFPPMKPEREGFLLVFNKQFQLKPAFCATHQAT